MTRGKGEGTIYKDATSGLWYGRIELPSANGKRRRPSVTGKTKNEVIRKLDEKKRQLAERGDLPTDTMTVAGWFDYWLREVASKDRRPKTIESYRSLANQQIIPRIGKVRLNTLGAIHVRRVVNGMTDDGMSSTTARNAFSVMSAAFQDAVREGRIFTNPTTLVKAPLRAATDLEVLTVAEAKQAIRDLLRTPDGYLWATYMLTGARRGEIVGLEWNRVGDVLDLSWQLQRIKLGATVPVNYERRHVAGGLWLTRPKSAAGTRVLPLVSPLTGLLAEWQANAPSNPWGLVFTRMNEDGEPIPLDPDWISRAWPEARKSIGIGKHVRLHDLRHGAIDMMYDAGVDEPTIMRIFGHSTRAVSRSYASKALRDRDTEGMKKLAAGYGFAGSES